MNTDWEEVVEAAADQVYPDVADVKEALSLEAVLSHEYGIKFVEAGGRLLAICPFHNDSTPSFAIYGENGQRAGCWSCGWRGDVIDVLQTSRGVSFVEALRLGVQLADTLDAPERGFVTRQVATEEELRTVIDSAMRLASQDEVPLRRLLVARGVPCDVTFLHSWKVGVISSERDGAVLVGHYGPDGRPTGYKVRTPYSPWIAGYGSTFPHLYGSWRDQRRPRVYVAEGETDTWTLAWLLQHQSVDVLGLPYGASIGALRPEWKEQVRNRDVVIAFDADHAGDAAWERWSKELHGVAARVTRLQLEPGKDVTSSDFRMLSQALGVGVI